MDFLHLSKSDTATLQGEFVQSYWFSSEKILTSIIIIIFRHPKRLKCISERLAGRVGFGEWSSK